jgi:hypothetical protein
LFTAIRAVFHIAAPVVSIKSVIKNKVGEREGVRLPISVSQKAEPPLSIRFAVRQMSIMGIMPWGSFREPLQPTYHAIVPLSVK